MSKITTTLNKIDIPGNSSDCNLVKFVDGGKEYKLVMWASNLGVAMIQLTDKEEITALSPEEIIASDAYRKVQGW